MSGAPICELLQCVREDRTLIVRHFFRNIRDVLRDIELVGEIPLLFRKQDAFLIYKVSVYVWARKLI